MMRSRLQSRRSLAVFGLAGLIVIAAAGIAFWRPADAVNDPYRERLADWTIEQTTLTNAFVGYGVLTYRPDWNGPSQSFNGPALLRVDDAETPIEIRIDGDASLARDNGGAAELKIGEGPGNASGELSLSEGDTLSLSSNTPFQVVTGAGQGVRLIAVVLTDAGPPATPGIEQADWRSWLQTSLPPAPFTVSLSDLQLAGGEAYDFTASDGPALLAIEGLDTGALSIGVTVLDGVATYQRVASRASWELSEPFAASSSRAALTPQKEKRMDVQSGVSIDPGARIQVFNGSLVDGTAVRMIRITRG
jgi:hypothetical protein